MFLFCLLNEENKNKNRKIQTFLILFWASATVISEAKNTKNRDKIDFAS